jgi:ankyrin repeat protein
MTKKKNYIIWTSVVVFIIALLGSGAYYYLMYLLPRQIFVSMIQKEKQWKANEIFREKDVVELCKAIEKNDTDKIDMLLKSGVNINAAGKKNLTPLFWALAHDNFESFRKLLEHGADPNIQLKDNVHLPLLRDTKSEERRIFGAGSTIVTESACLYPPKYLELALKHGGNPNLINPITKLPPIYALIVRITFVETDNDIANLKLLIEAGADINDKFGSEVSILEYAVRRQQPQIILTLLNAGADYRQVYRFNSDILINLANSLDQPKFSELRRWFEENGFDIAAAKEANKLKDLPPLEKRHWLPENKRVHP